MKDLSDQDIYVIAISDSNKKEDFDDFTDFLFLLLTAGYYPGFTIARNVKTINPSTYIGGGFIKAIYGVIQGYCSVNGIDLSRIIVATNFDLTGTQRANLKKTLGVEVIDRTFVILKIFENNAHTKEAKLQVDIATLTWSKNHLVNAEGAYSQVTSGGGLHNKGSGEKQITLDRRHINLLIDSKKRELEKIKIARKNSRSKRNNSGVYKVAVVGYTNAGKSTLLNRMLAFSHGEKFVESRDSYFVTLETATREISKYGFMKLLLTDTVGFIRNLPTTLVEAFKSTLEEVKEADLIVHVVDISDKRSAQQIEVTESILKEIGAVDIPIVRLYNKFDLLINKPTQLPDENTLYCSLKDDEDILDIYRFICGALSKDWKTYSFEFPFEEDYGQFSSDNYVLSSLKNKNGYQVTVKMNPRTIYKYRYLLDKNS